MFMKMDEIHFPMSTDNSANTTVTFPKKETRLVIQTAEHLNVVILNIDTLGMLLDESV